MAVAEHEPEPLHPRQFGMNRLRMRDGQIVQWVVEGEILQYVVISYN